MAKHFAITVTKKLKALGEITMRLFIPVPPLSINAAFQGRRFKTKESKVYDMAVSNAIQRIAPLVSPVKADWYEVHYQFYVNNFKMSDVDNLIKQTQDCIVRTGLISDDRRIKRITVEKFQSAEGAPAGTFVEILPYLREN